MLLLFQRTGVEFPASMSCGSQPSPAPGDLTPLLASMSTGTRMIKINPKNLIALQSIMSLLPIGASLLTRDWMPYAACMMEVLLLQQTSCLHHPQEMPVACSHPTAACCPRLPSLEGALRSILTPGPLDVCSLTLLHLLVIETCWEVTSDFQFCSLEEPGRFPAGFLFMGFVV